jgi:hypothetical protein
MPAHKPEHWLASNTGKRLHLASGPSKRTRGSLHEPKGAEKHYPKCYFCQRYADGESHRLSCP